jgi:hypothetical protein
VEALGAGAGRGFTSCGLEGGALWVFMWEWVLVGFEALPLPVGYWFKVSVRARLEWGSRFFLALQFDLDALFWRCGKMDATRCWGTIIVPASKSGLWSFLWNKGLPERVGVRQGGRL